MRNRKNTTPTEPNGEQLLEEKVDAMMDPKRSDPAPGAAEDSKTEASDAALPPLDIFAGATGAPAVPVGIAKDMEAEPASGSQGETEAVAATEAGGLPVPEAAAPIPLDLDAAANDAAVDDIEAHESDEPEDIPDVSDDLPPVARTAPKPHRHPIFWVLVTIIAVIAIVAALLLAGGGNLNFPGGHQLQRWFTLLSNKFGG